VSFPAHHCKSVSIEKEECFVFAGAEFVGSLTIREDSTLLTGAGIDGVCYKELGMLLSNVGSFWGSI